MSQFLVVDVGVDFYPVKLADVESATGAPAKHKSFLSETKHTVEQLITKHILWRLVQLACTALIDLAFVYLTVVLTLRDNQQTLFEPSCVKVLCNHESITNMCLGNMFFLPPVFCDVTISATDFDTWEHFAKPLHQNLAHDVHKSSIARRTPSADV